jgi:hypothetical protein
MVVVSPAWASLSGSWGVPCSHFFFLFSFSPVDLPSTKLQGNWTTSNAFDSHLVFNGDWHHLAIAVEDTKSDALL